MNLPSCDLFSGAGGFSSGTRKAGFTVVSAIDYNEIACETYRNNFGEHVVQGDVRDEHHFNAVVDACLKNGVVYAEGSPPCQGYSLSGFRNVIDERNTMVRHYLRFIKHVRPRVFVMENVQGIISSRMMTGNDPDVIRLFKLSARLNVLNLKLAHDRENVALKMNIHSMIEQIKSMGHVDVEGHTENVMTFVTRVASNLGYNTVYRVLDAADYGVPQHRKRMLVMGAVDGIEPSFPEKTHVARPQDVLFGTPYLPFVTARDAIDDLKDMKENAAFNHVFTKHGQGFQEKLDRVKRGESIYNFKQGYKRIHPDTPSPTVLENHNGVLIHYDKTVLDGHSRMLTPRELARLQSFPDTFIFEGSKSAVLKQVGNAVPPLLAEKIALHVRRLLE